MPRNYNLASFFTHIINKGFAFLLFIQTINEGFAFWQYCFFSSIAFTIPFEEDIYVAHETYQI